MTTSDKTPEPTPIGDEAKAAAAQPTETLKPADSAPDAEPIANLQYLEGVDEADVTHFDEDDDPQQFSGEAVEEN